MNASYPSGHTAAAIAIYCGLALLLTSRLSNRSAQVAVWAIALLVPVFVAFSGCTAACTTRWTSQGGVLVGIAALSALVLVSRAANLAATRATDDEDRRHRPCRQDLRRRLAGTPAGARAPGSRRSALDRGSEEPLRPEAGDPCTRPSGAELLFAWGGDGTVQRCIDALAGSDTALAILPAGTANLLATNLDIPQDIEQAVAIGLRGERHQIDVGRFEGERFAVMAGRGIDASMIQQADGTLKDRLGRVAYVWTGSQNLRAKPFRAKITVDGAPWYAGDASCILVGNVGRLFGGIEVFEDARPDDGRLEIGVVNAEGVADWVRTLARTAVGQAEQVAARPGDHGDEDQGQAQPQGALRARRRRPEKVKSFKVSVSPARSPSAYLRRSRATMASTRNDSASRCRALMQQARGSSTRLCIAILSRAGFVARAVIYGIIGLLAFDLVIGHGGKITNQQGALRTVEQHPFGNVLLAALAVGLGGYSLWRLFRAALGHGREGADRGIERIGALGSGIVYALICAVAVQILVGSGGSSSKSTKQTASDVFAWPGGRWLIGIAGLVMLGVAGYQFIRGSKKKFLDDAKTEEIPNAIEPTYSLLGTVGHVARAVVFCLVGIFLVKAAYDYKANEAIGLDGALAKLYDGAYGSLLLGAVAVGLIAFACFSLVEARFRRI